MDENIELKDCVPYNFYSFFAKKYNMRPSTVASIINGYTQRAIKYDHVALIDEAIDIAEHRHSHFINHLNAIRLKAQRNKIEMDAQPQTA